MSFPPPAPPLADVQRTLAVFAHPDDVDFGCAGTIARWVDEGVEVTYLIVTRGDAGGFDDTPRERMPARREAEQRAAAAALGVRRVDFLDGHHEPAHHRGGRRGPARRPARRGVHRAAYGVDAVDR